MAPSDATPKSLFPGAATHAAAASPGAFATPATVEFPTVDLEGADMSTFGDRVRTDQDADLLDTRVSHVRDVHFVPSSPVPDASPVGSVSQPVAPSSERSPERAWRGMVKALLAGSAVGLLVAAVVVTLYFLLTR